MSNSEPESRPKKSVLAISGSLRDGSLNTRLLKAAIALAPDGMKISIYKEMRAIPLYDADLERSTGGGPQVVKELRAAIQNADGLLISTPEYNQSITGVLKNAIDWASRADPERVLAGKPAAITGATTGRWGTRYAQAVLRHVLTATGARVMPGPQLFLREAEKAIDYLNRLADAANRDLLKRLLEGFSEWMDLIAPPGD